MTGEFAIAVHALVYLNHRGDIVSSDTLATNVCTNPARIRKVMAKLKKAGLLSTKEGVDGGYIFVHDPARVNLRQVCEALDVQVVTAAWKSGNTSMECLIASGMGAIMDNVYDRLDKKCKEELELITIADIDQRIFAGRDASENPLSCGEQSLGKEN